MKFSNFDFYSKFQNRKNLKFSKKLKKMELGNEIQK
jgi:hypothetical protein